MVNYLTEKILEYLVDLFGISTDSAKLILKISNQKKEKIYLYEMRYLMNVRKPADLHDTIMELYWWRILIPIKVGTLEWSARQPTLSREELYEIPTCIQYSLEKLIKDFDWDYKYAVKRYFRKIAEEDIDILIKVIEDFIKKSKNYHVTAQDIVDSCKYYGLTLEETSKLIAELKGGGFISPTLYRDLFKAKTIKQPIYEVNKALFIKELRSK